MVRLESERLLIRNFRRDDAGDLHEYLSQETVLRYEPEGVSNLDECRRKVIERAQSDVFLAVVLKENGRMIGHIYFNRQHPLEFYTWELGYIFNPQYYGQGYATEACQRVLQYGFKELKAHRIIAMCNPENSASWKLLERLQLRREGHHKKKAFFYRTEEGEPVWHDAYQYAILAEELGDQPSN